MSDATNPQSVTPQSATPAEAAPTEAAPTGAGPVEAALTRPTPTAGTPPRSRTALAQHHRPRYRLTAFGVVRGEWIKTLGLRSTWWTLGVTVLVMVGFAALIAFSVASAGVDVEISGGDPILLSISAGLGFGQLAVAVLGAIIITGEFSTGSIRSTFAAVPRRTGVLLGKGVALSVLVALTGLVATGLSLGAGLAAFSGTGHHFDASDSTTLRVLLGTVLYLVTLALFSMGVGAILRNSTGSIFTLVAILFVLPTIAQIAGAFEATRWIGTAGEYLPATAGLQLLTEVTGPDALTPWQGYGVFAAWTVIALLLGWVLTKKRDA